MSEREGSDDIIRRRREREEVVLPPSLSEEKEENRILHHTEERECASQTRREIKKKTYGLVSEKDERHKDTQRERDAGREFNDCHLGL